MAAGGQRVPRPSLAQSTGPGPVLCPLGEAFRWTARHCTPPPAVAAGDLVGADPGLTMGPIHKPGPRSPWNGPSVSSVLPRQGHWLAALRAWKPVWWSSSPRLEGGCWHSGGAGATVLRCHPFSLPQETDRSRCGGKTTKWPSRESRSDGRRPQGRPSAASGSPVAPVKWGLPCVTAQGAEGPVGREATHVTCVLSPRILSCCLLPPGALERKKGQLLCLPFLGHKARGPLPTLVPLQPPAQEAEAA